MPLPLFHGSGAIAPIDLDTALPAVDRSAQRASENYIADDDLRQAVDVAVYLGMPLLLTGEPGTGKTQLAYRVAAEFGLDEPLVFDTRSSSIAGDLFYSFDAVRRFALAQTIAGTPAAERDALLDPRRFVRYQALGRAILDAHDRADIDTWLPPEAAFDGPRRSVVLIDEIDKAPRDFPNDLLNAIDRRRFQVQEVSERAIEAPAARLPIVIITSNSEKQLPDAFLRRCIYHHIEPPTAAKLAEIVALRLPAFAAGQPLLRDAIVFFQRLREDLTGLAKKPSTAELLNWLDAMLGRGADPARPLAAQVRIALGCATALAKTEADRSLVRTELAKLDPSAAA